MSKDLDMGNNVIQSLSYNQTEIIKNIMSLNSIDNFDLDMTYGNGVFYKNLPEPKIKLDIDPQRDDVISACSTATGLDEQSLNSAMFDPPFLTYVRAARSGNGNMVMSKRFSGYWRYDELSDHYIGTIKEAARILKHKGVFVMKCQDIIHNHKMHCTHMNVVKWADEWFRLKDLFILAAKHRMPSPNRKGTQKHARVHPSYYLVLERRK